MTTIAVNKEMMAADTLCDLNGLKTRCNKIFRKGDGIIGTAGDSQEGMEFVEWYGTDGERPEFGEDFEAIVLTDKGMFWYGKKGIAEKIEEEYFAIGAGSHIAISYMDHNATPAQAVYAACMRTVGSEPPIQIERL